LSPKQNERSKDVAEFWTGSGSPQKLPAVRFGNSRGASLRRRSAWQQPGVVLGFRRAPQREGETQETTPVPDNTYVG